MFEALLSSGAAKVTREHATIEDYGFPGYSGYNSTSVCVVRSMLRLRQCPDVTLLVNNAGVMLNTPILAPDAVAAMRIEMEVNVLELPP